MVEAAKGALRAGIEAHRNIVAPRYAPVNVQDKMREGKRG